MERRILTCSLASNVRLYLFALMSYVVVADILIMSLFICVEGMSDDEIIQHISVAVKHKQKELGGNISPEDIASHRNRPMILIGG